MYSLTSQWWYSLRKYLYIKVKHTKRTLRFEYFICIAKLTGNVTVYSCKKIDKNEKILTQHATAKKKILSS